MAEHRTNCAVYDPLPDCCTCDYDEQILRKSFEVKLEEWRVYALQLAKQTEIWMKRAEYLSDRPDGEMIDEYWKRIDAQVEKKYAKTTNPKSGS